MMKIRARILMFLLCVVSVSGQVLDRIVAVVDNDLILESELNAQLQFFIFNNKLDANTPGLKEQVLQSMINEKLIVAKAIEDSVVVSDDEVQQQLDATIQQRVAQFGSESKLEEVYGMPISRIKREFRDEMRKNLLAQRLQQQRFGQAQISRREVEEFFAQYKDSIGQVPEEVDLAHIAVKLKPGTAAKAAGRAKAQTILDSVKAGVDFAELAKRYSEDPGSAAQGGDLGFVRRGQFVKEFETAVFSLQPNQISGIVETDFGYHIIQLLERRGDAVHARHILIRVERTEADNQAIIASLDSLRTRALNGEGFAELAKKYSENEETAILGGSLGTAELQSINKSFYPTVAPMKQGEISKPARLAEGGFDGYHIVFMKRRTPAHPISLEQDYHRLEALALNYKKTHEYSAWLEELRGKIYWQSRL
ncbi:MAG TPA: peptidylprolyl isomerase [Bacteroidota bacterium]|nr:peptidylprolyl isomerase [Bacteroidota bacterium]